MNNSAVHSPIVGYAFDGFPIYGPYGYIDAYNASSGIRRMISGYILRSTLTTRNRLPNSGTVLSTANVGPNVNTTYPLGSFIEDYEFSIGDLDDNNGRWYEIISK